MKGKERMKIRIIALLITIILILTLASCFVTSRDTHVEISCDDFAENPSPSIIRNDFTMEIGDKLYVKLCSNPTTGFEWSYEMSGDTAVKEEDHDFEEPEGDVVGVPGKETWTFEATEKGETTINMEYSQPWEGGIKGEWTYTISVIVE
jgi:predicted secreted protein